MMARDWQTFYDVESRGYETPCWMWRGPATRKGYGLQSVAGRNRRVHRLFYELHVGPIPLSHAVHHVCENKLCVNPAHLSTLTPAEHNEVHDKAQYLGPFHARQLAARTHCRYGHPFDESNTYVPPSGGTRRCRTCDRARRRISPDPLTATAA